MRRRDFIMVVGGAAAAWPFPVRAQTDGIKRLGILRAASTEIGVQTSNMTLLRELAQLGWTEGRNLRVDYRLVGSNALEAARPHAEALVRAAPDVIFASPATAVLALRNVTRTIPIVFVQSGDPVQSGIVETLTRPGGNITGFVNFEPSINTKYLQLLKDIAPHVKRVAVFQTHATSWRGDFAMVKSAAASLGVTASELLVRSEVADIARALAAFASDPGGGLVAPPDNGIYSRRAQVVALAAKHRLPAVYSSRPLVDAGGLMSYAAAPADFRLVASYINRILRGAKVGDLPVQMPTKFELVIKLKAATDLGLTIPSSLLALADEVIE